LDGESRVQKQDSMEIDRNKTTTEGGKRRKGWHTGLHAADLGNRGRRKSSRRGGSKCASVIRKDKQKKVPQPPAKRKRNNKYLGGKAERGPRKSP